MSEDATVYRETLDATQHTLWSFDLNTPPNPEGDATGFCCPAEAYVKTVSLAVQFLTVAADLAWEEIPEQIQYRLERAARTAPAVIEEMATQEPEVRRYWAVSQARDLIKHLAESLEDEGKPHKRVVLPKLARRRRTA